MGRSFWLVALALAWCTSAAAEPQAILPLSGHVMDRAAALDREHASNLEQFLSDYEDATGVDIAVLIIPSTAPESIDQYSIRVVEQWKLGHKGVDDGVLVLLATENPTNLRRLRIETGRGVQGVLTDAKSSAILRDVMAPYVHVNDFNDAVYAGAEAIARLLHPDAFHSAEPVLALGPLSLSAVQAPVAAPAPPVTPAATRSEVWFGNAMATIGYSLLFMLCAVVVLSISALFTKGGRARFKDGRWPEAFVALFVYGIFAIIDSDKSDERSSGAQSSDDSKGNADRGGNFDGGGASAN